MIHKNKAEKWGLEGKVVTAKQEPEVKFHYEKIRCPNCGLLQAAKVLELRPWNSYVHTCYQCNFMITESDWDVVGSRLVVNESSFISELMNPEMSGVEEFHENIGRTVVAALRIKLEERGYQFPDDQALISFIENKISGTTQFLGGSPFNKIVMFSIKGEDSPLVGIYFSFVEKELGFTVTIKARDTTTPD